MHRDQKLLHDPMFPHRLFSAAKVAVVMSCGPDKSEVWLKSPILLDDSTRSMERFGVCRPRPMMSMKVDRCPESMEVYHTVLVVLFHIRNRRWLRRHGFDDLPARRGGEVVGATKFGATKKGITL